MILVEADGQARAPQYLHFTWIKCQQTLVREQRVPEVGILSARENPIARVQVQIDTKVPAERSFVITGMAGDAPVSWAIGRILVEPSGKSEVTARLTSAKQPDSDGDGIPDPIDRCTGGPVDGGAEGVDGSLKADAGTAEVRAVDTLDVTNRPPVDGSLDAPTSQPGSEVGPPIAAPVVNAGPNQTLLTASVEQSLDGTVMDDGLPDPPGMLTIIWSKVSGPGRVQFLPPDTPRTRVKFSAPGTFVLRLTAGDGAHTAYDDVTVTVIGP